MDAEIFPARLPARKKCEPQPRRGERLLQRAACMIVLMAACGCSGGEQVAELVDVDPGGLRPQLGPIHDTPCVKSGGSSSLMDGLACTLGCECSSGYCVDGVCCKSACDGPCQACSAAIHGGVNGICTNFAANTDPFNECADQGASSCGTTGLCNGSGACGKYPAGTVCRGSGGPCDPSEVCLGNGTACPGNVYSPSTTVCRAAAGPCDVAEYCTGISAPCRSNVYRPSGYQCRASAGICDVAETCTGASASCPRDGFAPSSAVCRASAGPCDVVEHCTGISASCPGDGLASTSTVCRAYLGPCDVEEYCSGASVACPNNALAPAGLTCRASTGPCDVAEVCNGVSAACPADAFAPITQVCGPPAVDECDIDNYCSGQSATCTELLAADGTVCTEGVCQAGACEVVFTSLAAGSAHALALRSSGEVFSWGANAKGQLGQGFTSPYSYTPAQISALGAAEAIAAGESHSLALLGDGSVRAWGSNLYGQLGNGNNTDAATPVSIAGSFIAIAAGYRYSLAVKTNGEVLAWGYNGAGQLGDGTTSNSNGPVTVNVAAQVPLSLAQTVTAGDSHSLALRGDGTVWAWGRNLRGQVGQPQSMSFVNRAVQVQGLSSITAIAAGANHSLALSSNGTVWAWGRTHDDQFNATPQQVSGLSNVAAIYASGNHSVAVRADDGLVWTWGANEARQLGRDTLGQPDASPDPVPNLGWATAAAAGNNFSFALLTSGLVMGWGANDQGQLGIGSVVSPQPQPVSCLLPY